MSGEARCGVLASLSYSGVLCYSGLGLGYPPYIFSVPHTPIGPLHTDRGRGYIPSDSLISDISGHTYSDIYMSHLKN